MSKLVDGLIQKYPIISDQIEPDELRVILENLEKALDLGVSGDIVEFGCFVGTTSLFIQRLIIERRKQAERLTGLALEPVSVRPRSTDQDVQGYGDESTGVVKPEMVKNLAVQDTLNLGRLDGARPVRFWVYDSFDGLPDKTKEDESPIGVDFKRGELRSTKAEFIHNFRRANLPLPIITKKWFHEIEDHELPEKISFAFLDGDYYKSIRASLSLVIPRMQKGGLILIDDYDNPALPGVQEAVKVSGLEISSVISSIGIILVR